MEQPGTIALPAARQAYLALERLIVTLELVPGSFVTEGALIDRLGLGRTPVREAIQRLAWEGLIEVRPRMGLAIAPLEAADWPRILDVRRGAEIILARSAARLVNEESAKLFHASAIAMHDAVLAGDVIAFLEADKALDEALAVVTDNPYAARLAAPLQTHSRRFWFRFQKQTALADSASAHVGVIQAVLEMDEEAAGREADRLIALLRRVANAVV